MGLKCAMLASLKIEKVCHVEHWRRFACGAARSSSCEKQKEKLLSTVFPDNPNTGDQWAVSFPISSEGRQQPHAALVVV